MKKEGIQTRNRKLSTKSKKKKGLLGFPDMLKPLDKVGFGGFGGGGSGFSSMSSYMYGGQMHGSGMTGGFMSGPPVHGMSAAATMSGVGLGLSSASQIQIPSASSFGLSSGNSIHHGLTLSGSSPSSPIPSSQTADVGDIHSSYSSESLLYSIPNCSADTSEAALTERGSGSHNSSSKLIIQFKTRLMLQDISFIFVYFHMFRTKILNTSGLIINKNVILR
ncbi:hypothetical protein Avbf_09348 [Armadillidium vulgare]|nr:hypothetical protein Avbf_09348 [Armadillidium vulgare]